MAVKSQEEMRNAYRFFVIFPEVEILSGKLGVDGSMILKRVFLETSGVRMLVGFAWLRLMYRSHCGNYSELSGTMKAGPTV